MSSECSNCGEHCLDCKCYREIGFDSGGSEFFLLSSFYRMPPEFLPIPSFPTFCGDAFD